MSGTGQKPPGRLRPNRLAPFEKPRGEVPEVVGSPPPYVPPGPPPSATDALINAGLFEACMSSNLDHFASQDPLDIIRTVLSEEVEPVILQERRNALMLWPEAWNAMSVDQFATEILKLIGPETPINKDAYAFIRSTLQVLHTDKPVLTLRDVITGLSLPPDRDQDSYMNIPLSTFIHLKKILVRHTLIYNISPLQKVIDTFNSLHGDPNMRHNASTILTMNGAIVQTILFGIYDVHDPDHLVKENGIVVGFAPDFTNLWRSEQQVKAQVFLSGKTVKESLSGIQGYAEATAEGKGLLGHETEIIDLYGNFRNQDPRHMMTWMTWNNPEPRIVSFLLKKLRQDIKKKVTDTVMAIWKAPGPETETFIHMFTDNKEFRRALGIRRLGPIPGNVRRLGPIPGNVGYVPGGGFNINNPGINPYPGYPGLNVAPERRGSGSGNFEIGGVTTKYRSELGTRHLGDNGNIRWRGSNTGVLLEGGKRKTRSKKSKKKGKRTRSKK